MNGFADHGLDDDAFSAKGSIAGLQTFDAFPKTKSSYTTRSSTGGYATIFVFLLSLLFSYTEIARWYPGEERQYFSVEKGVAHQMQINVDIVVRMRCADLHANVQDPSGDRIVASEILSKTDTAWGYWTEPSRIKKKEINMEQQKHIMKQEEDSHVGHVLGEVRVGGKSFEQSPKLGRHFNYDACRIFGSLEVNRVQGDFHITARGHGYMEFGTNHLEHDAFNFTHLINEFSFGPLYPSILNPLDLSLATTEAHFSRFQYYMSVVPTIYTKSRKPHLPVNSDPQAEAVQRKFYAHETVVTNQFSVTSRQSTVHEGPGPGSGSIPGIFFKYEVEPMLLTIMKTRGSVLALLLRIVNIVSGILVGGGWLYQLWGWAEDNAGRRGRRGTGTGGMGMIYSEKGVSAL